MTELEILDIIGEFPKPRKGLVLWLPKNGRKNKNRDNPFFQEGFFWTK